MRAVGASGQLLRSATTDFWGNGNGNGCSGSAVIVLGGV